MTKSQKVLVVDASRVVRASLARYLKKHFEVCEDADGESAWQTLVLDSSITAVISGCQLAVLDGLGLVERMRENRLGRLNSMPFFLLVSDSFSPEERRCASLCGVSDFIPKGMAGLEMNALLSRFVEQLPLMHNRRLDEPLSLAVDAAANPGAPAAGSAFSGERSLIGATDIMGQVGRLAGLPDAGHDDAVPSGKERSFLNNEGITEQLAGSPSGNGQGKPVGLLVFGLDGYDLLARRHGSALAERLARKISGLLADKIRGEDCIGHLAGGRIVIIAPHTDVALCAGFANRVCKALAGAQISLRGQRLGMTVSVGIAAQSDDASAASVSARDLLQLATARLETAMRAGGNRVIASDDDKAWAASISPQEFLARLKDVLAGAAPEVMAPCLAEVGVQIMPILDQLEQTYHFGLPVDEMRRRLVAMPQDEPVAS